ncbi:hypothetical protein LZK73_19305 [Neorhizobium galegae]|nr:hypothetical protein LZK73_19305 [Neorhizobium galegae]
MIVPRCAAAQSAPRSSISRIPKKAPEGTDAQLYSAYYLDGTANSNGEYYGMRIDLPLEDVEALTARLTDHADCIGPVVATPEGEHGQKPKADGHGAPSAPTGHGEPVASSHGAAPADAQGAPAEGHGGEVAAKESGGFFSSVTGMIFGSGQEAPAQGHAPAGNPAAPETHAAAPAAAAQLPRPPPPRIRRPRHRTSPSPIRSQIRARATRSQPRPPRLHPQNRKRKRAVFSPR